MLIKFKKKGYYNKRRTSEYGDESVCPFCKINMEVENDLYNEERMSEIDEIPHSELQKIAEKEHSMEATIWKCYNCKRRFLETEERDYDFFILRELDSTYTPNPSRRDSK